MGPSLPLILSSPSLLPPHVRCLGVLGCRVSSLTQRFRVFLNIPASNWDPLSDRNRIGTPNSTKLCTIAWTTSRTVGSRRHWWMTGQPDSLSAHEGCRAGKNRPIRPRIRNLVADPTSGVPVTASATSLDILNNVWQALGVPGRNTICWARRLVRTRPWWEVAVFEECFEKKKNSKDTTLRDPKRMRPFYVESWWPMAQNWRIESDTWVWLVPKPVSIAVAV